METNNNNNEGFVRQTAKDYCLPLHMVRCEYEKGLDGFYERLEAIISSKWYKEEA